MTVEVGSVFKIIFLSSVVSRPHKDATQSRDAERPSSVVSPPLEFGGFTTLEFGGFTTLEFGGFTASQPVARTQPLRDLVGRAPELRRERRAKYIFESKTNK